jgi:hypothetical protein
VQFNRQSFLVQFFGRQWCVDLFSRDLIQDPVRANVPYTTALHTRTQAYMTGQYRLIEVYQTFATDHILFGLCPLFCVSFMPIHLCLSVEPDTRFENAFNHKHRGTSTISSSTSDELQLSVLLSSHRSTGCPNWSRPIDFSDTRFTARFAYSHIWF